MSVEALLTTLQPAARLIRTLDLNDTEAAERALSSAFAESWQHAVGKLVADLAASGELTPKTATDGLTFGRLSKRSANLADCTLDAVDMAADVQGAEHIHPKGEISLCFAVDGAPVFEGVTSGWQVQAPNSQHIPVVTGGRMRILYFLPEGSVEWA